MAVVVEPPSPGAEGGVSFCFCFEGRNVECACEAGSRLTLTTQQLGGRRSCFLRWGRVGEHVWGERKISRSRSLLSSLFSLRFREMFKLSVRWAIENRSLGIRQVVWDGDIN